MLASCAFWLAVLCWSGSSAVLFHRQAPEPAPSPESVLDRYVEVTGGKDSHAKLHDVFSQGRFEVLGTRIRGKFTAYEAGPNLSRSILEIEGGDRIEEGTIGGTAWFYSPKEGARLKQGEERAVALREAVFNPRLFWRKLYPRAESAGSATVEGDACHRVILTPSEGRPVTHDYGSRSGLLLRSVIPLDTPAGSALSENYYQDYRESSGVRFPHRLVHRVGSEEVVVTLEEVRCNTNIARTVFDPPPAVRALQSKPR